MKKLLAIILSILLFVSIFVSCKNDEKQVNTEMPEEELKIESAEQLFVLRTEKAKAVESMSCNMAGVVDVEAVGEQVKLDLDLDIDYNQENKLCYADVKAVAMEEVVLDTQMYIDMGENATIYLCNNGEWVRQSQTEQTAELYADIFDMNENLEIDTLKYIKNAEFSKVEYNGKECYRLTYDMELDYEDVFNQLGMSMEEIFQSEGVDQESAELVMRIFKNLGGVSSIEYIDAATLLPVYIELDMTECVGGLVDEIIDYVITTMYGVEMSAEDLGIEILINEVTFNVGYDSYNDVTIEIPEEVLNAPEAQL